MKLRGSQGESRCCRRGSRVASETSCVPSCTFYFRTAEPVTIQTIQAVIIFRRKKTSAVVTRVTLVFLELLACHPRTLLYPGTNPTASWHLLEGHLCRISLNPHDLCWQRLYLIYSAFGQESFKGETCIYRYHLIFKHSLPEAGQAQHSFAKNIVSIYIKPCQFASGQMN